MSKLVMSWPDRFALINHYNPTDEQVCTTFGLTRDELDTARTLLAAGTFRANASLDVAHYGNVFTSQPAPSTQQAVGGTVFVKPETASKPVKVPQKRGRKGDKIATALAAVPTTRVPVDDFIAQHGVSLAVLRQAKRFMSKMDPAVAASIGKINVRQDKGSKVLHIWREAPSN